MYSGNEDIQIKQFVYRSADIARNFVGLTPYEILLNFVPFESAEYKILNDKVCYKVCPADGENEYIKHTLLLQCGKFKRITGIKVVDKTGELCQRINLPRGKVLTKVTINMPLFQSIGD